MVRRLHMEQGYSRREGSRSGSVCTAPTWAIERGEGGEDRDRANKLARALGQPGGAVRGAGAGANVWVGAARYSDCISVSLQYRSQLHPVPDYGSCLMCRSASCVGEAEHYACR